MDQMNSKGWDYSSLHTLDQCEPQLLKSLGASQLLVKLKLKLVSPQMLCWINSILVLLQVQDLKIIHKNSSDQKGWIRSLVTSRRVMFMLVVKTYILLVLQHFSLLSFDMYVLIFYPHFFFVLFDWDCILSFSYWAHLTWFCSYLCSIVVFACPLVLKDMLRSFMSNFSFDEEKSSLTDIIWELPHSSLVCLCAGDAKFSVLLTSPGNGLGYSLDGHDLIWLS